MLLRIACLRTKIEMLRFRSLFFYLPLVILFFTNNALWAQKSFENDFLKAEYEYVPDVPYEVIEQRMQEIENEIPLNFNNKVRGFVDYFTIRNREYTKEVMQRTKLYFPIFEEALERHGLPPELKYLSIVESGLKTHARSRAAAVGLWQFISSTGTNYGLHQDWYIDERMDPYESTEAACRFMKQLHKTFGDWELALAAYNCGPGNVRKAIRRSGYKKKFWEIYRYLPRETRSYVPQFVAVTYTFNFAEEHHFYVQEDQWEYPMSYDTVHVSSFTNLKTVSKYLNLCEDDIRQLNPSIKHRALPDNTKNYAVRFPTDLVDTIRQNKSVILDSVAKTGRKEIDYLARNSVGSTWGRTKVRYKVRSGDVIGAIAQTYGVRVKDIRTWNRLRSNTIRIGQTLNIWVKPSYAKARPVPPKKEDLIVRDYKSGSVLYKVQPGDTLWDISRKYNNLSVEKIKKLNNLKTNSIKPGQLLVIG